VDRMPCQRSLTGWLLSDGVASWVGRLNPVESARPRIGQRGYCCPGGLVVGR
jgi:hypothetical protein